MISASHNPFADNGIKLFGPVGYKLSDKTEATIEQRMEKGVKLVAADKIGRARRIDDARGRYIHHVKSTFPERLRLDGLKIVVDCANGAAYHVAPEALWELGADVIPLGVKPDGLNIVSPYLRR
jgi:phosphoglucosamine mutase